jgi:hypothetical protein
MKLKIIYRISDSGYNKVKPDYINNENCLKNFVSVFGNQNLYIIADNCSEDTLRMITKYCHPNRIEKVSVGHGAGTFNLALDMALTYDDDDVVYFVENDYIHLKGSPQIIKETLELGVDYGTLYLHPDKFIPPIHGGNPEVDVDGGYLTKIYRGKTQLYHPVNSTTMTFFSEVSTLKKDESILRHHTSGTHPEDFKMFLELRDNNKFLMCPLNTFSTHGETQWLAPLYKVEEKDLINEWGKHIQNG